MKAIVLLSGGIDSCVVLAHALSLGRVCTVLSFDYGQRHLCELHSAERIATYYGVEHITLRLDPALFSHSASSALTNPNLAVDTQTDSSHPNTYVPCRNLLFLSHAACIAESAGISEIFFGANANDGPSYPDCRPAFFHAFENTIRRGTNMDNKGLTVICPLIDLTKRSIVALGKKLQAPLDLTWSCYDPHNGQPCTVCPACTLRADALSDSCNWTL